MNYKFQKWFFDLNVDEDTYIYFILVEIKFLFFKIRNFTFHYYHYPTGSIIKSKSIQIDTVNGGLESLNAKGKQMVISHKHDNLEITSYFDDLKLNLKIYNYQKSHSRDSLIISRNNNKIEWYPVPLFMTASGTLFIDKNILQIEKSPVYIDYVFSDILPFNTPVSKMFWGRLLHAEIIITYSVVYNAKGQAQSKCFVLFHNQQLSFSDIQYIKIKGLPEGQEDESDESIYRLVAGEGEANLTLNIRHMKTAAAGAFIVPEKYKFKMAYRILNRISKKPGGKKFISKADISLVLNGENYRWEELDCIDEYVIF